jgi:hypothetical protein
MQPVNRSTEAERGTDLPADLQHPRGTLAIVVVFGVLFALGWFAMYVFMFLSRGAPHA